MFNKQYLTDPNGLLCCHTWNKAGNYQKKYTNSVRYVSMLNVETSTFGLQYITHIKCLIQQMYATK